MFSVKQILGQDASLKPLVNQLSQQQRLNRAWQTAAPDLQHLSQATSVEEGTLIVVAESGLVANKIKLLASQLIPRLNDLININCLPTQRHHLTAIKVKVQAKSLLKQGTKRITGLSKIASEELASFAQTTKNQALKEKLLKISAHVNTAQNALKNKP